MELLKQQHSDEIRGMKTLHSTEIQRLVQGTERMKEEHASQLIAMKQSYETELDKEKGQLLKEISSLKEKLGKRVIWLFALEQMWRFNKTKFYWHLDAEIQEKEDLKKEKEDLKKEIKALETNHAKQLASHQQEQRNSEEMLSRYSISDEKEQNLEKEINRLKAAAVIEKEAFSLKLKEVHDRYMSERGKYKAEREKVKEKKAECVSVWEVSLSQCGFLEKLIFSPFEQ